MISDKLSFIALENGYVWGTVGRQKEDEFRSIKPDLRDWIALLHAELNEENGKTIYAGLPSWKSKGRHSVDDIDVAAAYPSTTIALNVSNKTTRLEVCQIEGLDRMDYRKVGINYASSPQANAVELCNVIYGMPAISDISTFYTNTVKPFIEKEKEAA